MQKLVIAVAATAALVLCGSALWVAQATPFAGSTGRPSQDFSPIERIGCTKAGDNCPYGQRIVRHTGHGPSCEPCSSQTQKSKASPPSGPPPSRQPHNDEGYDRGREGYDRGDEGYDRGDEGYDRGREAAMEAMTIGAIHGRMTGITALVHPPAGALTTSLPMAGKSAAVCNSVRCGTAALE
jgi:hypothetical protein